MHNHILGHASGNMERIGIGYYFAVKSPSELDFEFCIGFCMENGWKSNWILCPQQTVE